MIFNLSILFRISFLNCTIGFTMDMLFDERKYAYHLMLQYFHQSGTSKVFFQWVLSLMLPIETSWFTRLITSHNSESCLALYPAALLIFVVFWREKVYSVTQCILRITLLCLIDLVSGNFPRTGVFSGNFWVNIEIYCLQLSTESKYTEGNYVHRPTLNSIQPVLQMCFSPNLR